FDALTSFFVQLLSHSRLGKNSPVQSSRSLNRGNHFHVYQKLSDGSLSEVRFWRRAVPISRRPADTRVNYAKVRKKRSLVVPANEVRQAAAAVSLRSK